MPVDDEVDQLRSALRGMLGTAKDDRTRAPDPSWRDGWTALAGLGLAGLCAPEAAGGSGLRADAAAVVSGELGSALHGAPFAGLTAGVRALTTADPDDPLAASALAGDAIISWGRLDGGSGVARLVDGAGDADVLVLRDGDALLVLEDRASWSAVAEHPFDVTRRCVDVQVASDSGRRIPDDPVAVTLFGLLLAADSAACVERMLATTVAYAKERQAFGKPIGGFQAVQHRLVDHAVRSRGMGLVVAEAARLVSTGSPDAPRLVAMAEISVSSGATHILHDLLQLTGAIGFTWEHGLHFYERRTHQSARLAGNPRAAVATLSELEAWR